jgi:DNA repair ATPase RecN
MLKTIQLKNFEGHANTTVDLSSGVNIIAGESNAGKSSIFRALRFVFLNEPGGEEFINFDADTCEVVVQYGEHTITRTKGRNNKVNEYSLNGQVFKAFGQSVPSEIQQALSLNEINFEWQFDKRPFLISETGGYIASKLNEIVNLELIDLSLRNVDSMRRKANKTKEELRVKTNALEQELTGYTWVAKVEEMLVTTEALQSTYREAKANSEKLYTDVEELRNLLTLLENSRSINPDEVAHIGKLLNYCRIGENLYEAHESNVNEYKDLLEAVGQLTVVSQREFAGTYKRYQAYSKQVQQRQTLEQDIESLQTLEDNLTALDGKIFSERRVARVRTNYNALADEQLKYAKAQNDIVEYSDGIQKIKDIDTQLKVLQEEYESIAPDVCPLCGGVFNKELKK